MNFSLQGKSSDYNSNNQSNQKYVVQGSSSFGSSHSNVFQKPQYTEEQLRYMKKTSNSNNGKSEVQSKVQYSLQGSSHPKKNLESPTSIHNTKSYKKGKNRVEKAVESLHKSHVVEHVLRRVPGGEAIVGGIETGEVLLDGNKSIRHKTSEIGGIITKSAFSFIPHGGSVIGQMTGKIVEDTIKKVI